MALETPIAFCIYNRPVHTLRVFDAIAKQKPKRLLVIGDGPRTAHPLDERRVDMTRSILSLIDWPCELKTEFSDTNMGCRSRMASGISWAFDQSEELIILEDDCLPHDSFFGYCEQLLERYRTERDVMMISGNNFQPQVRTPDSYYFSRYTHIWGWASWRRAWDHYDLEMESWPEERASSALVQSIASNAEYEFWKHNFDEQHAGQIDTWDFAWMYACLKNKGLTVLPESNLVSNLGFGTGATHTTDQSSSLADLETSGVDNPLRHPVNISRHSEADRWTYENIFQPVESIPIDDGKENHWLRRLTQIRGQRKSA